MNTAPTFAILNYFLLISCFQLLSMAAPTLLAKKGVPILSSHIKRDVEYRNTLFSTYRCRVEKATEAVTAKLEVIFIDWYIYSCIE